MDIQDQTTQPINDDQELAKVLAGVNGDNDDVGGVDSIANIAPPTPPSTAPPALPIDSSTPADQTGTPVIPDLNSIVANQTSSLATPIHVDGELDGVKKEALSELRPLVDKLNLPAEEKFDTYLLLIRSTDDKSLISPAHEAAKSIADETRRAQALLDIIKEIDFLSNQPA